MNDLWQDAATLLEAAADQVLLHGLYQGGALEDPTNPERKCTVGYLSSQSVALFGMVKYTPTRPELNLVDYVSIVEHEREIYFAAVSAVKAIVPGGHIPRWSDNEFTRWNDVRDTLLEAAKSIRSDEPNERRDDIFAHRPGADDGVLDTIGWMAQPFTITEMDKA